MKNIFAIIFLTLLCSCASNQTLEPTNALPPKNKGVGIVIPLYSQKIFLNLPNANWKPTFKDQSEGTYRIEFGEKANAQQNDWQKLISIQGFKNMAQIPPQKLLDGLTTQFKKSCPNDFKYKDMGPVSISSYSGTTAIIGCSQNPKMPTDNGSNHKGELGYYFAIQGEKDLYLIHKAYRGQSTEINKLLNEEFAEQFIADILPIKICMKAGHEAECIE